MLGPVNVRTGKWGGGDRALHKGTILVVDDEPESLELMRVLLASQGYSVATASCSEAAVHLVEQGGIDLVVCDLMMAKMDGVELCAYIRRTLGLEHLPVIFVTSLHDRASRIRAKEAGGDDLLVKPVDGLELLVRVESLLQRWASIERAHSERNQLLVEVARLRDLVVGEAAHGSDSHALVELGRAHTEALENFVARGGGVTQSELREVASAARAIVNVAERVADVTSVLDRRSLPSQTGS
jgi:DNA-binding response OmpR family regulator